MEVNNEMLWNIFKAQILILSTLKNQNTDFSKPGNRSRDFIKESIWEIEILDEEIKDDVMEIMRANFSIH